MGCSSRPDFFIFRDGENTLSLKMCCGTNYVQGSVLTTKIDTFAQGTYFHHCVFLPVAF